MPRLTPLLLRLPTPFVFLLLSLLTSALPSAHSVTAVFSPTRLVSQPPPNIILILADDLGASDLGCYGSTFHETPHLDQLARDGLRFTQAYSACTVCSPSRASILTGKSPARLHLTDWIAGHPYPKARLLPPQWEKRLAPEHLTIAEHLRKAGYRTAAVGKWHLGGPECAPTAQGFDLDRTSGHRGQPPSYIAPFGIESLAHAPTGEFLTDREATEVCQFIHDQKSRPFFIYYAPHAVHTPLSGKPAVIEKYRQKAQRIPNNAPHRNPTYAALLESLDDAVGAIRRQLHSDGLAQNTLILFTSDNGGLLAAGNQNPITSNLGLRAGKGSPYEGGVRVPLIAAWPSAIAPQRTDATPIIGADLFDTLLAIARAPSVPTPDSVSFVPALRGEKMTRNRALFWHYPHYHPGGATPYSAIRRGAYRLVEFFEDGRLELYHLEKDPMEQNNLAAQLPSKVRSLSKQLKRWRESNGAQLPIPNPNFTASQR